MAASSASTSHPSRTSIDPLDGMPWVSIFASSTVSIGASKGLLDNFVLPAAPTGDETLYYEYAEDPDQRMRNRSLLFPTWNDPILLQRVQDSHMEVLKVVEYGNCEHLAQFLNSDQRPRPDGLLMNIEIPDRNEQPWASGISLEAAGESSILFIRVPYLGFTGEKMSGPRDSLRLGEWRRRIIEGREERETGENRGEIWVHQAWVVVIRLETILTAKSACDQSNFRPRLMPLQKRSGIFHAAIHMIAGILRSSDSQTQKHFNRIVAQFERQPEEDRDTKEISIVLVQAVTIRHLLVEQIAVLEQLQPLFVNTADLSAIATGSEVGSMVGESGGGGKAEEDEDEDENLFNTDVIEIPVISALSKKEVRRVHAMIDRVISQRKRMMEKMSDIIGSLKDMCKSTEQARGVMQQKAIKETVQEQLRNAEILGDEITYQGKTLSMFTAVNVLFLPLGFFSQFLALDSVKSRINTQGLFWAIAAPITALFVGITLYYVIISQYEIRKIMRFLWILLRYQRWQWFLKRSDAHSQKMYLLGLPKYKIKVIVQGSAVERYLKKPDGPPEGQKLTFGDGPPGEFRFDKTNNYLFLDLVDKHDYMYFAHISPCIPQPGSYNAIEWRRIRLPFEREPLYFKGRFELKGDDLCAVMSSNGRIMWDNRLVGYRTGQLLHAYELDDSKKLHETRDFIWLPENVPVNTGTVQVYLPSVQKQQAVPPQQPAHPQGTLQLGLKMELMETGARGRE